MDLLNLDYAAMASYVQHKHATCTTSMLHAAQACYMQDKLATCSTSMIHDAQTCYVQHKYAIDSSIRIKAENHVWFFDISETFALLFFYLMISFICLLYINFYKCFQCIFLDIFYFKTFLYFLFFLINYIFYCSVFLMSFCSCRQQ